MSWSFACDYNVPNQITELKTRTFSLRVMQPLMLLVATSGQLKSMAVNFSIFLKAPAIVRMSPRR